MNILVPVCVAVGVFFVALRLYPPYIARAFREDDRNPPPSERLADGRDYVKSRSQVVFAHHFATIAGAGPIVGPTLALAFGWQPVWLWIVIGGIFFGAVHDMSAMFASIREEGRSIGEIARRTLGPAGYLLNLLVLIFVLTIINAIFLNLSVVALTSIYPLEALGVQPGQQILPTVVQDGQTMGRIGGIATTSVFTITMFAPVLGLLIRRDRLSTGGAYVLAASVCVISILLGFQFPVSMSGDVWRYVMTAYVFAACALPVWFILQPRDFTNVQILYGGIALILVSAVIAGLGRGVTIQAPAVDLAGGEAALRGMIWPILFITVACGAISGFHSLVASGTTAKQIPRESDCRRIGYGAMIFESFLAVLVLTTVASMLPPAEYMRIVYPDAAPSNPVLGFSLAAGRLVNTAIPLIPVAIGTVFGILMIEGFVVTTLDSSVRLCRYLAEEFWNFAFDGAAPAALRSPALNTALVVALMFVFSVSSTIRAMWPVFGAGNQLIGALALITVSVWLAQRARRHLFALVPAIFMIGTTLAALVVLVRNNLMANGSFILAMTAAVLFILALGVVLVGAARFFQAAQTGSEEWPAPRTMPTT
jgi:carbon starvation protein